MMTPNYDGIGALAIAGMIAFFIAIAAILWVTVDFLFVPDTTTIELSAPIEGQEPTRIEISAQDTLYIYEETTPSVLGPLFQSNDE